MATDQVIVRGILKLDGSLELDSALNLPAGPVEVVLRSLSSPAQSREDWWQYLQRVRAEPEAAAGPCRTEAEIAAERQDFRRGDNRVEEMYRQIKGQRGNGTSESWRYMWTASSRDYLRRMGRTGHDNDYSSHRVRDFRGRFAFCRENRCPPPGVGGSPYGRPTLSLGMWGTWGPRRAKRNNCAVTRTGVASSRADCTWAT